MPDQDFQKNTPRILFPAREKRRYLHPAVRYLIVSVLGIALAGLISFLLRKIGY